jgi:hypothetical protein
MTRSGIMSKIMPETRKKKQTLPSRPFHRFPPSPHFPPYPH